MKYCASSGYYLDKPIISQHWTDGRISCAHTCMVQSACGSFNYDKESGYCQVIGNHSVSDMYGWLIPHPSHWWYSPFNCRSPIVPCKYVHAYKYVTYNIGCTSYLKIKVYYLNMAPILILSQYIIMNNAQTCKECTKLKLT